MSEHAEAWADDGVPPWSPTRRPIDLLNRASASNEENRTYPPSVQPGIPKLRRTPAGWRRIPLKDVLEPLSRPVNLGDSEQYQLVTAKRSRAGIVEREILYGHQIKTKTQFLVKAGDFLISRRQIAHGACGLVPQHLDGAIVSNEYSTLRTKEGLEPRFLRHLTNSIYFQQTCFHSSIGVHVEKLVFKLEEWLEWEFDLPSVDEQRTIANALDAWDRAIKTTEALITAKRNRYATLRRWLIDGFAIGVPPENTWPRARLVDIVEINSRSLSEQTDPAFRFRYFDLSSANSDDDEDASGWITFEEAPSRARRLADPGDVIYATVRPLLRRLFIAGDNPKAVYSTGYAVLHPRPGTCGEFIYHLMTSRNAEHQIHAALTGSGYPAINVEDLGNIEVPCPPPEDQQRIARILDAAEVSTKLAEKLRDDFQFEKRGLMQRLLAGDWRLRHLDQAAPLMALAGGQRP